MTYNTPSVGTPCLQSARLVGADREAVDRAWAKQHAWGGVQIYRMAVNMKGFHLKGAQWLGARPDICPMEWVEHLSKLQDRCPPMSTDEVRTILETELGANGLSCLQEIDDEP